MLVPKNAYVAAEMFRNYPGRRIRYVHATKTRLLKRLIPHRTEAFFADSFGDQYVQHLYYAHVHVLKSLDVHNSVIRAMGEDFALMAEELGETFVRNAPDPKIFLHKNGWPRISEDPSNPGTFLIVGRRPRGL